MNKQLLFVMIILFSLFSKAELPYVGAWKGYCDPLFETQNSQMCSYKFNKDKSGVYTCEKFKDLRCTESSGEKMELKFSFKDLKGEQNSNQIKLKFKSGEFIEETYVLESKDKILSLTGIEAHKKGEKEPFKATTPVYYFTRE